MQRAADKLPVSKVLKDKDFLLFFFFLSVLVVDAVALAHNPLPLNAILKGQIKQKS